MVIVAWMSRLICVLVILLGTFISELIYLHCSWFYVSRSHPKCLPVLLRRAGYIFCSFGDQWTHSWSFWIYNYIKRSAMWRKQPSSRKHIRAKMTPGLHLKYILSQSYNATVFYFDNISFPAHVLNQLFLPNESSISQASYRTMVLTICFQLFKK